MSGNDLMIACPSCKAVITLRGKAMTRALTCQSCKAYFRTSAWNKSIKKFDRDERIPIPIGSRGKFEDVTYEVMGFVIKKENKWHYEWREYLLFNPFQGYAFLSEYNGHWNFIWPIEQDPRNKKSDLDFNFEGQHYQIYQRYSAAVVFAAGEFFFDVVDQANSSGNYEYISPPYLLALEKSDDSILWCKGEYITPKEVAEAFNVPVSSLPSKSGIGYTQPFNSSFTDQALISFTVAAILVTFFIQMFMNNLTQEQVVFRGQFTKQDLQDQKVIVTPTFELHGGTKSLGIQLYSDVTNDWLFSEFTLVNETDGTEYNFTKEVEYYSGYDDEGSWTEGSRTGEAFLSKIPEGRYHLNLYPEFGYSANSFIITVTHDVPIYVNFFITCIILLIYPAFHMIRQRYREQRRWRDSEYSPYSSEE